MKPPATTSAVDVNGALVDRLRELVVASRRGVARGIDLIQVHTCFEIGRHIFQHEQQSRHRASYGKALLDMVSARLTAEFGRGFSRSNVASMRSFYVAYQQRAPIVQTLSGLSPGAGVADAAQAAAMVQNASGPSPRPFALSWSHYVFLLGIKNNEERSFYEIEAADQGWNLREVKRKFDTGPYERLDVNHFDRHVRREGEGATVGIVLCKRKNDALVEITLPQDANIHAWEYQLYLPSKEELQAKLVEWAG